MHATGVWFGNEAWPSGASPGAFARDVFRIEKCKTDKDKALAFYKWLLRCMNRGMLPHVPGMGGMLRTADPLHSFSWGHHECTGWGWIAAEALQSAGVKARRAVVSNSGHTFYEVWYAGEDGTESWHAFDPFIGWYLTNDRGEVASLQELAENPDLGTNPRPGSSVRIGHHPERSGVIYPFRCSDHLDIVQPVRNEETAFHPQAGQVYSSLWRPENIDLAWTDEKHPRGAHCDISLYDEEGKARYPEHLPYWKNYVWPGASSDGINAGQEVRWHSAGAMRWQPLQFGNAVTFSAANAVFDKGTLRPSGVNKHCEVWYHLRLPFIATYLRLAPFVEAASNDLVGFAVSADAGKSVCPIHWANGAPPKLLTFGNKAEGPTIRGLREFWLRVDLSSKSASSPLCIRSLGVTVGYQSNMHILPRLLPGQNQLYLQAQENNGVRLSAEWAYSHPGGERVETLTLDARGRSTRTVNAGVEKPEDLIMRGVTLRCLPK
jgi:hypothetical protein